MRAARAIAVPTGAGILAPKAGWRPFAVPARRGSGTGSRSNGRPVIDHSNGRLRLAADARRSYGATPWTRQTHAVAPGLDDLAVIGMVDPDGLDDRIFATLDRVRGHGGEQWRLYASACSACGQDWMIAQDERIHDNFVLKRVGPAVMERIVQASDWPEDFLRFERVLRLERESGKVAQFLNPRSPALVQTVADLCAPYAAVMSIFHHFRLRPPATTGCTWLTSATSSSSSDADSGFRDGLARSA